LGAGYFWETRFSKGKNSSEERESMARFCLRKKKVGGGGGEMRLFYVKGRWEKEGGVGKVSQKKKLVQGGVYRGWGPFLLGVPKRKKNNGRIFLKKGETKGWGGGGHTGLKKWGAKKATVVMKSTNKIAKKKKHGTIKNPDREGPSWWGHGKRTGGSRGERTMILSAE